MVAASTEIDVERATAPFIRGPETRLDQIRLAVAIMAYGGQVCVQQARMWLELGSCLMGSTQRFQLVQFSDFDINPVDRARNFALAFAMRWSADWLLMIDADTFVAADGEDDAGFQLARMVSEAAHMGAAVVVAPVMSRVTNPRESKPMIYINVEGRMGELDLAMERRGLVPIDSAATAVMAINLNTIGEAQFRFVPGGPNTNGLSEDHEFCRQVREAGGKIVCDTRVRTGHMSKSAPLFNR